MRTLIVLFLLYPVFAHGADLTITCAPPTLWTPVCRTATDCDAPKPITTPITFNLYRPDQAAALATGYSSCVFLRTNLTPGTTLQHYVTAITSGIESDPSATVTSIIPPIDPVCAGAPANETRSQACPAPTTGTFEQAHGWTSVAAPACWSADPWTPVVAPAGSCIVPPASLLTASTSAYEQRSATLPLALVGIATLNFPCGPETLLRNGVKYCRVSKKDIDMVVWPSNLAGTDFWVKSQ